MIRIVGIQRSENPDREFILLQNQGSMRVQLRGHTILSENALEQSEFALGAHVFSDDVLVPPGMYVLLLTGPGDPRWAKTKDGAMLYHAYMHSPRPVWSRCDGPLHVLNTQHTYVERGEALLLR